MGIRVRNYQLVLTQLLLVSVEGIKLQEEGMFELQHKDK